MTKNADVNNYRYSRYVIGFDRHGIFPSPSIGLGRNVIIFGVGMSSATKIDNSKKYIFIFGKYLKYPTQGLEHTLSVEKMYWINFTKDKQSFA